MSQPAEPAAQNQIKLNGQLPLRAPPRGAASHHTIEHTFEVQPLIPEKSVSPPEHTRRSLHVGDGIVSGEHRQDELGETMTIDEISESNRTLPLRP